MDTGITEIFVWLRIAYDLIIVATIGLVIAWAVKNKQFKKQDYVSRLPLDIDNSIFNDEEE